MTPPEEEEQPLVDIAYRLLDRQRQRTEQELAATLSQQGDGTPAARFSRDAEARRLTSLLVRLGRLEDRLVFGRIDTRSSGTEPATVHVGRAGLRDENHDPVVVDWRSPAAEEFYQATPARPGRVVRRRHLRLQDRCVTGVVEDPLAPTTAGTAEPTGIPVAGEAGLLAAVAAARTGRMRDVVATLQAEQDRIIRSPLPGILVVEGAPGTGKTVVALHRAAYLLYTHRDRLSGRGVLLVGPNGRFLDYIGDVLPGLGEDAVTSTTLEGLLPDIAVTVNDPDHVAAVKGDPRMAELLAAAVRQWPRTPTRPIDLRVEDHTVVLHPNVVRTAQSAAHGTGLPHNVAREKFCEIVLNDLVPQLAQATSESMDGTGRTRLLALLHTSSDVRREVNLCWMPLTVEHVLSRLWTDPDRLAGAASGILTPDEQRTLVRDPTGGWSSADVPLLDELHELLGPPPTARTERAAARRAETERAERVRFARESLTSLGLDPTWVDPHLLADRYHHPDDPDDPAGDLSEGVGRLRDRERAWGHVVVDEAQDLAPMAWRMLLRRCPTRSMTVVGDLFQATAPAAPGSWETIFDANAPGRWRREELTVNYRTPGQISRAADRVVGRPNTARPLREGQPPQLLQLDRVHADAVAAVLDRTGVVAEAGTTVVVVADSARAGWPGWPTEIRGVPVLGAGQVKGLEFDHVVLVEPAAIAPDPAGLRLLYVALTRATQSLLVVHAEPVPAPLADPVGRPRDSTAEG